MRRNFGEKVILSSMLILVTNTYDGNEMIDSNKFSAITYEQMHHAYRRGGDVVGYVFGDRRQLKNEL